MSQSQVNPKSPNGQESEMAKAIKNAAKASKASKAASKPQTSGKAGKAQKAAPKAQKPQNANQSPREASEKALKTLDNCYRPNGGYWAAVQALRVLGINKSHSHDAILAAVKKALGADGWKAAEADAKGGKLNAEQRALLNVAVTARKDYGEPLRAIGYKVRWDGRAKTAGLFKL